MNILFTAQKKLRSVTFVAIFITAAACNQNVQPIISDDSKWLIENDDQMDHELDKVINEMSEVNDTLWLEKSFVITDIDTTVLGIFAKKIKDNNPCFEIMYTHFKTPQKQKKITILRDLSGECKLSSKIHFELIDSTEHFKISFDTLQ